MAVDLESDAGPAPSLPPGLLILSHHEPADGSPGAERWTRLARELAAAAAEWCAPASALAGERQVIVKLAAPTPSAADALDLSGAAGEMPDGVGAACVGLGPGGQWLRVLARRPGPHGRPWSALAYCAADEPLPGPPLGQLSLDAMLDVFRADRLGAGTRVFAIAGWPLAATWSPALHSLLLAARGIDGVLVSAPCRSVDEIARVAEALDVEGLAITMPHKEAARALAASESPAVRRSGVLNTLRRRAGRFEAESFDGAAVAALLAEHVDLSGARIVVVGAGGAARAAGAELAAAGARVTFVARREQQARDAARTIPGARAASLDAVASLERDALVQATPAQDLALEALDARVVLDMVSHPVETRLLARARAAGSTAIDGLAMLAHQAAAQQRWWQDDATAPTREAVERLLRGLAAHG